MALTLSSLTAACGGDDMPAVDCAAVTPPTFANVALFNSCVGCHSAALSGNERFGAPGDVNYDTYAAAVANADHGVHEVESGSMPPVGSVSEADKQDFYAWAMCGTPQ